VARRKITYYWGDRNLLIKLGNRTHMRIRALYFAEFLVTSGMATVFLVQSLPFHYTLIHWVAALGASLLYLLAAQRFLARMFFSERLLLEPHSLTIIKKTIFSQQVRQYDWRHVGTLHYAGKGIKTDHPLKGKCFDYFGFETQEHLIQSLHHDGNMYFDIPGGRVYFASGVYSWHAEEMVQMMKVYLGTSLKLGPEWEEMLQEQEFDEHSPNT
jgi:hypothetical protein